MRTLIIVNNTLKNNNVSRQMLLEKMYIDTSVVIDEHDNDLQSKITALLSISNDMLLLCNEKSAALCTRILSLITGADLLIDNNIFTLDSITLRTEGSTLYRYQHKNINLITMTSPYLLPQILLTQNHHHTSLHAFGYDESSLFSLLSNIAHDFQITLDVYTHVGGWSVLKLSCEVEHQLFSFVHEAKQFFPHTFIEGDDVVAVLVAKLKKHRKTITFAESCTGGRVAALFTAVPGSSSVFYGSVCSYSNQIKSLWLGVRHATLASFGAVSADTVLEMAQGARKKASASYALAISGIAGPDGGSKEKPVGTVFIAYANEDGTLFHERLLLEGDREAVQKQASYHAIRLFIESNRETFL
jgi:nicotinamide-nucleotide amidase